MFDKSTKKEPDTFGRTNRITEGTIIKGDIISETDFRLDGHLIGNFSSTGKIVIGLTGKIIGDITCINADIEGMFEGKMDVSELLHVKEKAKIKGDVITGKLSVESGAEFLASCSMKSTSKGTLQQPSKEAKIREEKTL